MMNPIDLQQRSLIDLIERYTQRTLSSKQRTQQYRAVLADPRVSMDFHPSLKEMCYPIVAERSRGSRIWDVDGNEYIDMIMGFGINLLGHNPPFVREAIQVQLEKGIQLGPQSEVAGEVAALISELTGMERIALSNTGTEAVMTAVRLARAATGRSKIAIFSGSYHGHSDGTLAIAQVVDGHPQTRAIAPGIPSSAVQDVVVLEYGSSQSLEMIQAQASDLAAVLVEPIQSSRPDWQPREFLQQLRQVTQANGIALIFDEMVTGFRLHLGGAQTWFGVRADIATYGKIVGGGLPIGVIAGSAHYLDWIDGGLWQYGDLSAPRPETTFFAGTHCKHPLALASARAILQYLKQQGPSLQENLNQRTAQFVDRLNQTFAAAALPIQMVHSGSLFGSATSDSGDGEDLDESTLMGLGLFAYHLRDRGILFRGDGGFLSTAHTDEDLDTIVVAVQDSIYELAQSGFFPSPVLC